MLVNITGKEQTIKALEEARGLIEEASKILYRIPTQIKIEVEECDTKSATIDSQDIR